MDNVKKHDKCRLCGGGLDTVMDYGALPLANALAATKAAALLSPCFEQVLLFCHDCLLGQLSVVVAPETLYKDYVYQSSVSRPFLKHCAEFARDLSRREGVLFIDIAGNDGALAGAMCEWNTKAQVFVIDPAQNTELKAPWVKLRRFWDEGTAREFTQTWGHADVITAQNVVGHVDDIQGFFRAVHSALKPGGTFIVEIPSFLNLVRTTAFDTVYHEHVSYWSVTAMRRLARLTGFELVRTKHFPVHCGSFRFYLRHGEQTEGPCPEETAFFAGGALDDFAQRAGRRISLLSDLTAGLNEEERADIVGITASAKSTVLLNMTGADFLAYHVDDTPVKQGRFTPGTGKEIKPFTAENVAGRSAAFILSRNLTLPLTEKLFSLGFTGVTVTG